MQAADSKGLLIVGYLDDDCVRAGVYLDGVTATGDGDLSFTLDEWMKLAAWSQDDDCPDWFWATTDEKLQEA